MSTKREWKKGSFNDKPFARSLLTVYREDGEVIAMALTPGLIAFEEAEANAHLIAASPELYEALKELLGVVAQNALPSEGKIRRAEKALAKADGE